MSIPARRQSVTFQSLVLLALMAWMALAMQVVAAPHMMHDAGMATLAGQSDASCRMHCTHTGAFDGDRQVSAPDHAGHGGALPCTGGNCQCPTACGHLVDVDARYPTWLAAAGSVPALVDAVMRPVFTAPDLRPPIV